jgi:6-phosphogluconolactonase
MSHASALPSTPPPAHWLFVGTHRGGPGTGISRARFDATTGALSPFELAAAIDDPAFLVAHPDGRHLYAANSGTPGGVTALALDATTGGLAPLHHTVSEGRGPSHLSLDRSGRFVLDANYGGAYVEVIALDANGDIGVLTAKVRHEGHGTDPVRQDRAYVHAVLAAPDNRFALVADLGLDRVYVYRFDAATGALAAHDPPYATTTPGTGPRHMAWHPNGRLLYLIEELGGAVTTFAWDADGGRLRPLQTASALPAGFSGENTAAEILVHPGGRWLYASNRGHDSIVSFEIVPETGTLQNPAWVSSGGRTPRYMALDPTGRWLLVSNVDSDHVRISAIDPSTGRPRRDGTAYPVHRPCGLVLVPAR